MQLRSGTLDAAPVKKYASPYQIFLEERKSHHRGLQVGEFSRIIGDEFELLDEKKRDHYEKLYEKHNDEFKHALLLFYGASKHDVQKLKDAKKVIPEKPKRPTAPYMRFQHSVTDKIERENPEEDMKFVHKIIKEMYVNLTEKEKAVYEDAYERDHKLYLTELESWNEKYQEKSDANMKFVEQMHKRKQEKDKDEEFVYQEFIRARKPMKMKDDSKLEKMMDHKPMSKEKQMSKERAVSKEKPMSKVDKEKPSMQKGMKGRPAMKK